MGRVDGHRGPRRPRTPRAGRAPARDRDPARPSFRPVARADHAARVLGRQGPRRAAPTRRAVAQAASRGGDRRRRSQGARRARRRDRGRGRRGPARRPRADVGGPRAGAARGECQSTRRHPSRFQRDLPRPHHARVPEPRPDPAYGRARDAHRPGPGGGRGQGFPRPPGPRRDHPARRARGGRDRPPPAGVGEHRRGGTRGTGHSGRAARGDACRPPHRNPHRSVGLHHVRHPPGVVGGLDRRHAGDPGALLFPPGPPRDGDHRPHHPGVGDRHLPRHGARRRDPQHHVARRSRSRYRHAGGQLDRGPGGHRPAAVGRPRPRPGRDQGCIRGGRRRDRCDLDHGCGLLSDRLRAGGGRTALPRSGHHRVPVAADLVGGVADPHPGTLRLHRPRRFRECGPVRGPPPGRRRGTAIHPSIGRVRARTDRQRALAAQPRGHRARAANPVVAAVGGSHHRRRVVGL